MEEHFANCRKNKMTNIVNLTDKIKRIATKPAHISCNIWGHHVASADGHTITFRCFPTVTITKTVKLKSNDEVLVQIISRKFGIETFTSRELSEHAATDQELLSALGGVVKIRSIGTMLRNIKGITAIAYGRHIASWKVGG
jgi:hypothetical protein